MKNQATSFEKWIERTRRLASEVSVAIVITGILTLTACKTNRPMQKVHEVQSEVELFLPEASKAMEQYRTTHGVYAQNWNELDMTFVNGPYRLTDQGIRPASADGNRWRPKLCDYSYEILRADRTSFLIQAINKDGTPEFEIEQGMEVPRKIRK